MEMVSVDAIMLLVKTKETVVLAFNVAVLVVICPVGLFSVTPVALFVPCVTVPPAPVP